MDQYYHGLRVSETPTTYSAGSGGGCSGADCPTKVSELINDLGFLTEHQSLDEYAKKTDVGTEVQNYVEEHKDELKGDNTPVKGVDYMTDEDIQEMVDRVEVKTDDGSITPNKLYGYTYSDNKYNRRTTMINKTVSSTTSYVLGYSAYSAVALAEVEPSTQYTKGTLTGKSNSAVMCLTKDKEFISYITNDGTFTTSENCFYIVFNVDINLVNSFMLVKGASLPTTYIPYKLSYNGIDEYIENPLKKYQGTFTNLTEFYGNSTGKFATDDTVIYATATNAFLGYMVSQNMDKVFVRYVVKPALYTDGAGITVLGISKSATAQGASLENTIGIAFNPTSSGNYVQYFDKGARTTLGWVSWESADFTSQVYYVDIIKDNHEISVHVVAENDFSAELGKTEYFYKTTDDTFDNVCLYVFSNDTRGASGTTINGIDYNCGLDFSNDKKSVLWKNIGSGTIRIHFPEDYEAYKKHNVVICFHGNGTDEDWSTNLNMLKVKNRLLEEGYIVLTVGEATSKTTWGNKKATKVYVDAYKYLIDNFNIDSVGVYCNSMGGIESLNVMSERKIPFKCWVGTVPTYNLKANYSSYTDGRGDIDFSSIIKNSYGIASDGSDYEIKTNGRDPSKMPNYSFGCVPMLAIGATGDTTINPDDNINQLYTDLYPVSDITKIMHTGGNHSDFGLSDNMSIIVEFYKNNL